MFVFLYFQVNNATSGRCWCYPAPEDPAGQVQGEGKWTAGESAGTGIEAAEFYQAQSTIYGKQKVASNFWS